MGATSVPESNNSSVLFWMNKFCKMICRKISQIQKNDL